MPLLKDNAAFVTCVSADSVSLTAKSHMHGQSNQRNLQSQCSSVWIIASLSVEQDVVQATVNIYTVSLLQRQACCTLTSRFARA